MLSKIKLLWGISCGPVVRRLHYVQGQSPKPNVREYFYYVDHQGQLFLDDARIKNFTSCFKEKDFLAFFFKRLKLNESDHYSKEFPYLSPCGRERNYIRCDDLPLVFTQILHSEDPNQLDLFSYCNGGQLLTVPFEPSKVSMFQDSGRVYHPAPDRVGGVGLVKSSIAIEFSKDFEFGDSGEHAPPTHFTWKGIRYGLENEVVQKIKQEELRIMNLSDKRET